MKKGHLNLLQHLVTSAKYTLTKPTAVMHTHVLTVEGETSQTKTNIPDQR